MAGFTDVPARAVGYLRSVVPAAPDDLGRYTSLSVVMDWQRPERTIAAGGFWAVSIRASWSGADGDAGVSLDVPSRVLLSDEYAMAPDMTEPLW